MVAKNLTVKSAEGVDRALQEFVHGQSGAKVLVYADDWGNLHAVVASGQFFGRSQTQRQELVWTFLRKQVPPEELVHLYRVNALTPDEYDACYEKIVSPGVETEILDLKRLKKGTTNESNGP
jgi:acid stress-induced BolA-like protein IbaG/YrbA